MPSVYLQLKNIKQAWVKCVNTEGVRAQVFEWIGALTYKAPGHKLACTGWNNHYSPVKEEHFVEF